MELLRLLIDVLTLIGIAYAVYIWMNKYVPVERQGEWERYTVNIKRYRKWKEVIWKKLSFTKDNQTL